MTTPVTYTSICYYNSLLLTLLKTHFPPQLLKVSGSKLREVLTSRTISARGDVVTTPLDVEQAQYARDALAKAIYDKHFSWLVSRLNASLAPKDKDSQSSVIGILDIYGFEIFPKNR